MKKIETKVANLLGMLLNIKLLEFHMSLQMMRF